MLSFLDEKDQILIEGMEKFCVALDVDPTDVVMLVMAYHLKAENMCEFTRSGFIEGWTKLRYDGISVLDCLRLPDPHGIMLCLTNKPLFIWTN